MLFLFFEGKGLSRGTRGRNADSVSLTTSAVGGSVTGESVVGNGTAAMELTQTITGFRSRT